MSAQVIIPAATAVIIQALQAWIAMARLNGMSAIEITELLTAEFAKFQQNTPDKLPDA